MISKTGPRCAKGDVFVAVVACVQARRHQVMGRNLESRAVVQVPKRVREEELLVLAAADVPVGSQAISRHNEPGEATTVVRGPRPLQRQPEVPVVGFRRHDRGYVRCSRKRVVADLHTERRPRREIEFVVRGEHLSGRRDLHLADVKPAAVGRASTRRRNRRYRSAPRAAIRSRSSRSPPRRSENEADTPVPERESRRVAVGHVAAPRLDQAVLDLFMDRPPEARRRLEAQRHGLSGLPSKLGISRAAICSAAARPVVCFIESRVPFRRYGTPWP